MDMEKIKEILYESLGRLDADETVVTHDVWLPVSVRPAVVATSSEDMVELMKQWPMAGDVFLRPEVGPTLAPRTFQRDDFNDYAVFALLAYGQEAGWWEVERPSDLSTDDGYANFSYWMTRPGFIHVTL